MEKGSATASCVGQLCNPIAVLDPTGLIRVKIRERKWTVIRDSSKQKADAIGGIGATVKDMAHIGIAARRFAEIRANAERTHVFYVIFASGVVLEQYGIILETKTQKGVDVAIIRQHTTKTSGYHTKPATSTLILRMALRVTQRHLEAVH
jgi:hypothetical protein